MGSATMMRPSQLEMQTHDTEVGFKKRVIRYLDESFLVHEVRSSCPICCCELQDCYDIYVLGCVREFYCCEILCKVLRLIWYTPWFLCCPQKVGMSARELVEERI